MFRIPIYGEINGKEVKVNIGDRYIISTLKNKYEGRITKCVEDSFLIKTVEGGIYINFDDIEDIERIVKYDIFEEVLR